MMRSLYSGVSGLQNHQIRMDTIGNNISNVNTYGFKKDRVTFQDLLYQNMSGASGPKSRVGGINAKQIGLGMLTASIDKIMTQGTLQTTGKNTDMAIAGDGFFVVREGKKQYYTRAGTFDIDKNGNLVNPANGNRVQGWNSIRDKDGNKTNPTSRQVEDISIPIYSKEPAKQTSEVVFRSNLNSAALAVPADATPEQIQSYLNDPNPEKRRGHVTSINVYDDKGKEHNLKITLWKTQANFWTAEVTMADAQNLTVDVGAPGGLNTQVPGNKKFQLSFSPDGKLLSASDGSDTVSTGELSVNLLYKNADSPEQKTIALKIGTAGLLNGITQFASDFTTKAVEQDGYTMGYMESFSIDNSGIITGVYSNGIRQEISRVATAVFSNQAGLEKIGQNRFEQSNNSGRANIGVAGVQGRGKVNAGLLEMSNVDLADAFTDMIVTQRGFQANSKMVVTSDQMLQEILGMKR